MTAVHAIIIVIIRVWAAGAIITAITNMPAVFLYSGGEGSGISLSTYNASVYVIWFIAGGLAWFLAPKLANKVYAKDNEDSVNITIDVDTLVMLGSFLIGGFYLVQYVPNFFTTIGLVLVERSNPDSSPTSYEIWRLLKDGLVIAIALWMCLRAANIARIFSHIRTAGLYKHDVEK